MVEVYTGWLLDFWENTPGNVRNKLLSLGLPVAGLEMEFDEGVVTFDGVFEVDKKGGLYAFGSRVNERMFIKLATIYSTWGEYFLEDIIDRVDLDKYTISLDGKICAGGYCSALDDPDEWLEEKRILGVKVVDGIPKKKFPHNVRVIDYPDDMVITYRKDNIIAKYIESENTVQLGCWDMSLYECDAKGDIIKQLVELASKIRSRRVNDWFVVESPLVREIFIARKPGIIIEELGNPESVLADFDEGLNRYEHGWTMFYKMGNWVYTKKNNGIIITDYGDRVSITFRNGADGLFEKTGVLYVASLKDYLQSFILF